MVCLKHHMPFSVFGLDYRVKEWGQMRLERKKRVHILKGFECMSEKAETMPCGQWELSECLQESRQCWQMCL